MTDNLLLFFTSPIPIIVLSVPKSKIGFFFIELLNRLLFSTTTSTKSVDS